MWTNIPALGGINVKHEANSKNYSDLELIVERKLHEYGLVPINSKVSLCPHHSVPINGEWFSHFIVTCTHSQQRFFLKILKENDNSLLCDHFLREINNKKEGLHYPQIVVPEFSFHGLQYYITAYIEGRSLDTFPDILPQNMWNNVADKLLLLIDQLASIKASQYSEHGVFVPDDCASILKKKLRTRFQHPLIASYQHKKLEKTYNWFCDILDHSQFSQPTLIHMDIKPANIIYNEKTGSVSLIDFEFARFGDCDYGWTQILMSGRNQFNQFYREQLVPRLTRNRLTWDKALNIPKFQCYLFYQAMCNLIYYHDRCLPCPEEFKELFSLFINRV